MLALCVFDRGDGTEATRVTAGTHADVLGIRRIIRSPAIGERGG